MCLLFACVVFHVYSFCLLLCRDNVCPVTRLEYLQTLLPLVQCVCEDVNSRRDGCLGVALLTFVKRTMSDVIAALQDGLCSQWLLADIIVGQTVLIVIVIESHSEMLGDLKQLLANIQQSGELGTQILLRASTANKCQSVVNSLVWECIPTSIKNADQATICTVSVCVCACVCVCVCVCV